MAKVFFVGAGPGDPDLLTLKGLKLLESAGTIIYPGSLISSRFLEFLKTLPKAKTLIDSQDKTLEELMSHVEEALSQGKTVVRLVSGNPALYSSIFEQIEWLRSKGYDYEIVPGVSSAFALSSRLGIEYTHPMLSHSVVLTRFKGQTGGAEAEEIRAFARTRSTLVFFLSARLLPELVETLLAELPHHTPACLAYRVTHPEEKIILTTLEKVADIAKREGFSRTTLLVVGEALKTACHSLGIRSNLYGQKDEKPTNL